MLPNKFSRPTMWLGVGLVALALLLAPRVAAFAGMQPLSTGVGQEERSPHPEYPLKLVFAVQSGAYLAAVDVTITDENGRDLLRTKAVGPWLFVDLPVGTFNVQARRADGDLVKGTVTVTGERQKALYLIWKTNE